MKLTADGEGDTEIGSIFLDATRSVRVGGLSTPGSAPGELFFDEGGVDHIKRV